jgi:hypothetical protein
MRIDSRVVAFFTVSLLAGCAAGRKETRPTRSAVETAARTPAPALAPELDPDNVEARFGFAEARARREERARKRQAEQQRVDLVDGKPRRRAAPKMADPNPGSTAEPSDGAKAEPGCPCPAKHHDEP